MGGIVQEMLKLSVLNISLIIDLGFWKRYLQGASDSKSQSEEYHFGMGTYRFFPAQSVREGGQVYYRYLELPKETIFCHACVAKFDTMACLKIRRRHWESSTIVYHKYDNNRRSMRLRSSFHMTGYCSIHFWNTGARYLLIDDKS